MKLRAFFNDLKDDNIWKSRLSSLKNLFRKKMKLNKSYCEKHFKIKKWHLLAIDYKTVLMQSLLNYHFPFEQQLVNMFCHNRRFCIRRSRCCLTTEDFARREDVWLQFHRWSVIQHFRTLVVVIRFDEY